MDTPRQRFGAQPAEPAERAKALAYEPGEFSPGRQDQVMSVSAEDLSTSAAITRPHLHPYERQCTRGWTILRSSRLAGTTYAYLGCVLSGVLGVEIVPGSVLAGCCGGLA